MDEMDVERYNIQDNDRVKVTQMNHITEVQYMEHGNYKQTIKRLDRDRYVDLSTGEIKNYNHIDNRSESVNSLRQTMKKLRYLINNNFTGAKNELFLTLTYAENMTDTKRLMADVEKFVKRLRYFVDTTPNGVEWFGAQGRKGLEYLCVPEPQQRGAWHLHVLVRFDNCSKAYIPNDVLAGIWGHGFVNIHALSGVDNIGAYLSAYLSNAELTEQEASGIPAERLKVVMDKGKAKKYLKGARLYMYPPGMNMYRKSRGIKPPESKQMSYKNAKKVVKVGDLNYSSKKLIEVDGFSTVLVYEQYNTKRIGKTTKRG